MKGLNIALLTIGIVCLAWGYVPWMTRHESAEIRTAQSIMTVVAGWGMTAIGDL
jgi:hypothetical protein